MSTLIRISESSYKKLKLMSETEKCSMTFLLDIAVSQIIKSGINIGAIKSELSTAKQNALSKVYDSIDDVMHAQEWN